MIWKRFEVRKFFGKKKVIEWIPLGEYYQKIGKHQECNQVEWW